VNVINGASIPGYIYFSAKLRNCNVSFVLKLKRCFNILQEHFSMMVRHQICFLKHFGTILITLNCLIYDSVSLFKSLTEEVVFVKIMYLEEFTHDLRVLLRFKIILKHEIRNAFNIVFGKSEG
jgi:hypothetical protein